VTRRILTLLAAVVVLVIGGPLIAPALATPALAEFHVLRSDPAAGATVTEPPAEVRITFDQPVSDVASTIQVSAQDGVYNSGVLRVDGGTTLVQPVRRLSPGDYSVSWTAASGPGAPAASGKFTFTVSAPSEPSAGIGQWIVVGVLFLIAAFLGGALLRRRLDRKAAGQGRP
jgi:methionine-rich copper-binding protein CopC